MTPEILLTILSTSVVSGGIFYLITRAREEKLRKLVMQLRNRIAYLEKTTHIDWPIPYWVKDRNGVMLACSQSYEEVFLAPNGKTKDDYLGRSDEAVWDEFTAADFRKNDAAVIRAGSPVEFIEMIPDNLGVINPWLVIKFPVKFDSVTIGVAGIALSISSIDNLRRSNAV